MTKKTRGIALVLAVLVLSVMLSSTLYIANKADHDCIGEHCQICQQISICQNTLKNLGFGVAASAIAIALTYILASVLTSTKDESALTTLITLKIKLSI